MTLNIISKPASTTLITCLGLYLILKTCLTFIFPGSFALRTQVEEEKVDHQEQCVTMYSRHSNENHSD